MLGNNQKLYKQVNTNNHTGFVTTAGIEQDTKFATSLNPDVHRELFYL